MPKLKNLMFAPVIGAEMVCTDSLPQADSVAALSSATRDRALIMSGLWLSDPERLRVVVGRQAADRRQAGDVPHVLGVEPRTDPLDHLARVVGVEHGRRGESRVDLRARRGIDVRVVESAH